MNYMANESYKERNNFILRTTFEKCTSKNEVCMAKAITKSYTLDCNCKCPCTFPLSYATKRCLVFDKNRFM